MASHMASHSICASFHSFKCSSLAHGRRFSFACALQGIVGTKKNGWNTNGLPFLKRKHRRARPAHKDNVEPTALDPARLPTQAAVAPETSRLHVKVNLSTWDRASCLQTSKSHSAPRPLELAGARRAKYRAGGVGRSACPSEASCAKASDQPYISGQVYWAAASFLWQRFFSPVPFRVWTAKKYSLKPCKYRRNVAPPMKLIGKEMAWVEYSWTPIQKRDK